MNEHKLFENTTEPEHLDDTVTDTQASEDTTADVSDQIGVKKRRKRRTKQSDDTVGTDATEQTDITDTAESNIADSKDSDVDNTVKESVPENQYKTGDPIDIRFALLYVSSAAPKHFRGIRGRYYVWDGEQVNGRVRLTDSPSGVGKPECIIGWVNLKNIQ